MSKPPTAHGVKRGLEYFVWHSMLIRCYSKNHSSYKHYGAKGISVCDRWKYSFANFIEDVGRRPSMSHTLDRYPNNQGNYEPGNVRWATYQQQAENRKNSILYEYLGDKRSATWWAKRFRVNADKLRVTLRSGVTVNDAIKAIYEMSAPL